MIPLYGNDGTGGGVKFGGIPESPWLGVCCGGRCCISVSYSNCRTRCTVPCNPERELLCKKIRTMRKLSPSAAGEGLCDSCGSANSHKTCVRAAANSVLTSRIADREQLRSQFSTWEQVQKQFSQQNQDSPNLRIFNAVLCAESTQLRMRNSSRTA